MKPENGRQTQGPGKDLYANKQRPVVTEFTLPTRREILYRFLFLGHATRQISKNLSLNNREGVERVIQDNVTARGEL